MNPQSIIVGQTIGEVHLPAFMDNNGLTLGSQTNSCGDLAAEFLIFPGSAGTHSWNYLWNNNRGRGRACTYFWVLCFRKMQETLGHFKCIGSCCSTEFELCSAKKRTVPSVKIETVESQISDSVHASVSLKAKRKLVKTETPVIGAKRPRIDQAGDVMRMDKNTGVGGATGKPRSSEISAGVETQLAAVAAVSPAVKTAVAFDACPLLQQTPVVFPLLQQRALFTDSDARLILWPPLLWPEQENGPSSAAMRCSSE
jgi:hypothetical protein